MATTLRPDQIEWVLSLDAKGVQSEIHSLSTVSEDLTEKNKELEKEIKSVEKQMRATEKAMQRMRDSGKENSDQYRDLENTFNSATSDLADYSSQVRINNKLIEENDALADNLNNRLRVQDMTMYQLRTRARDLEKQLNNTSQSTDPEAYADLSQRLEDVRRRMAELKGGANEAKGILGNLGNTIKGSIAVFAGNMMTKAVDKLNELKQKAIDFVKEGIEMAKGAEGVVTAFNKLANSSKILEDMKKATRGTISELSLMEKTLTANELGIPIDNMAKLMEYARMQAVKLKKDVNFMSESIVTGIGRQSTMILDNLGLNSKRIQEEVKKTGDFTQGVIKIVTEELDKQGKTADTGADIAARSAAKWEDAQLKVGRRFQWLGETWDKISGNIADGVAKVAGEVKSANERYEDQLEKVADLKVNIDPLLDRYDKLSKTVKLNYNDTGELTKEQKELRDVTEQIASAVPTAITALDSYGRAMSVNTVTAREYIKVQSALLNYFHADAINDFEKKATASAVKIKELSDKIKVANTPSRKETEWGKAFLQSDEYRQMTLALQTEIEEYRITNATIKRLNGTTAEEESKIFEKRKQQQNEFNEMKKDQLDAWIKDEKNASSEYLAIAKQTYQQRFGRDLDGGDDDKKVSKKQQGELAVIDLWLTNETNRIKKEYAERLITKQEYDDAIEKNELEAINRRLELAGLDESKRADIERTFYDFKTKLRDREDKAEEEHIANRQKQREELEKWNEEETRRVVESAVVDIDTQAEIERVALMEKYANRLIDEQSYQNQLLAIEQNALYEKLRIHGLSDDAIRKLRKEALQYQVADNEAAKKNVEETAQTYASIGVGMADQIGNTLTDFMQDSEASSAEFQYRMLMIALDTLRQIVLLSTAEAIAREIGSKGIFGIATGAAAAAAINLAFSAVKGLIKKPTTKNSTSSSGTPISSGQIVTNQRAEGKYDVIGTADGKRYNDVPYSGDAKTGVYSRPTLVGERGAELVVSHPDMLALQRHINYPMIVQAINDARSGRVQQRASGKYDTVGIDNKSNSDLDKSYDNELYKEMLLLLRTLNAKGVKTNIGTTELQAQMKRDKEIDDIFTMK